MATRPRGWFQRLTVRRSGTAGRGVKSETDREDDVAELRAQKAAWLHSAWTMPSNSQPNADGM